MNQALSLGDEVRTHPHKKDLQVLPKGPLFCLVEKIRNFVQKLLKFVAITCEHNS